MLFKQIELHTSQIDPMRTRAVESYIIKQIETMLKELYDGMADDQNVMKPIIRLKIEYGINGYSIVK